MVKLTGHQRQMAQLIVSEFSAAGLSWLAVSAAVNSYADAELDGGRLFVLDETVPTGWDLRVPRDCIRRVLEVLHTDGRTVLSGRGRTHEELSCLFAEWVLKRAGTDLDIRRALVTELYGSTVARTVP